MKAAVVLFPLLGVNNLLFMYNPGGEYEAAYMVTNAVVQASQVCPKQHIVLISALLKYEKIYVRVTLVPVCLHFQPGKRGGHPLLLSK